MPQLAKLPIFRTALVVAPLFICGCTNYGPKPDVFDTVPASGTLTYKNEPLEHYQVTFFQEGKRPAQGMTDAAGKFTLGTNAAGDGAPAGKHKVTVVFAAQSPLDVSSATAEEIMKTTPKPKVKIPPKYTTREKSDLDIEIPADGATDIKIELKD